MTTLLVQMADAVWTMEAVHLACTLARAAGTNVTILRLMPVTHPGYLGTDFGTKAPSEREHQLLTRMAETVEDYGIEVLVQPMQYVTMVDAIAQAAEELDADIVFARIPASGLGVWHAFQLWTLERRLRGKHCQLVTLDQPIESIRWIPTVTVRAAMRHG